jgi:AcrR family transcriptional regulator
LNIHTHNEADGRRRRGLVSQDIIIAAALELVSEGNVNPSAEDVAERAKLSKGTVFRQFGNMEQLHSRMVVEITRRLRSTAQPFQSTDWQSQLQEIMARRLTMFEVFLPFKRAADAYRHTSPTLQASHSSRLAEMRSGLESVLPPAILKKPTFLEAIDLLLGHETWQRLRIEQNLSEADARGVIETLMSLLLSAHGEATGASPTKSVT